MNRNVGIAVLMGLVLAALPCASRAQTVAGGAPSSSPAAASSSQATASAAAKTRPLSSIAAELSRASGAIILTDSTVASLYVTPPAAATTRANLETQLDSLVKMLPTGSTWAKVYLPVTGSASHLSPDAVTDYLMAQARLFGTAGAATPAGMVEIMGQRVAQDKATPVISTLNLKPVYILADPNRRSRGATNTRSQRSNSSSANQRQRYYPGYPNGGTVYRYTGRGSRRGARIYRYGFW